jgi:hypothetical protein
MNPRPRPFLYSALRSRLDPVGVSRTHTPYRGSFSNDWEESTATWAGTAPWRKPTQFPTELEDAMAIARQLAEATTPMRRRAKPRRRHSHPCTKPTLTLRVMRIALVIATIALLYVAHTHPAPTNLRRNVHAAYGPPARFAAPRWWPTRSVVFIQPVSPPMSESAWQGERI